MNELKKKLFQIMLGAVGSALAAVVTHLTNAPLDFSTVSLAVGSVAPALFMRG